LTDISMVFGLSLTGRLVRTLIHSAIDAMVEGYARRLREEYGRYPVSELEREAERSTGEAEELGRLEMLPTPARPTAFEEGGIDYCLECAEKHVSTANVFLREAQQRLEADEPMETVAEKVRAAVVELTGAEADTDSVTEHMVREINGLIRDLRKFIWREKLSVRPTVENLVEARRRAEHILSKVYEAARELAECPECPELIEEICGELRPEQRVECESAILTLARPRVSEQELRLAHEKLKRLDVAEKAMRVVERRVKR